ncbi:MAG: HNH endonuclease [Clostridia bacterium]|nr:HNH endonuclease [Clostridia bacterium]
MCAKHAKDNFGMATSHIPDNYNPEFCSFVEQQKKLYKQYSGCLLGFGIVSSIPEYDDIEKRWYSNIEQLRMFKSPIFIDDFKSFIIINRTNSITYLNDNQWEQLKWLIHQKNPVLFKKASIPNADVLNREFNESVNKAISKPLEQLKKEAKKSSSHSTASTVRTNIYHRNPIIAAYVKKRANGYCQLCGLKAPFVDQYGEPYLECHHIDWLSNGGMDSPDNCVALCPNCHRKMHIINDSNDINTLKSKAL